MNNQQEESLGYLKVKVSTARGAIPLENATVRVRAEGAGNTGAIYSLETDSSGITDILPLPAPPRALSQEPNGSVPYSLWEISVFCDGFISAIFSGVPVYAGITSIQNANLVPIPEGFLPSESYNESGTPNL